MLPKRHRVTRQREFLALQRGTAVRGPSLTLRLVRRTDRDPVRIAVVVSKRVSRRAVDRHQVTRWLREAARADLAALPSGVTVKVSATAPYASYSFPRCQVELHGLLQQARLL